MGNKVTEERGHVYGPPEVNHSRTARLWRAFLRNKPVGEESEITPEDVCWMNILQKIARAQHGVVHEDHIVDVAGYADNVLEIWRKSSREKS